ncbi:MAG: hypothetical protein KFH98_15140, partial [Gemmatimonadetes bacterium]|nr:hypothetical protein [Gemmatimonadota bacterium]
MSAELSATAHPDPAVTTIAPHAVSDPHAAIAPHAATNPHTAIATHAAIAPLAATDPLAADPLAAGPLAADPLAASDLHVPAGSQQAILQAVVRAATEFLKSTDLEESLHTLLAGIGTATQASRAYAFENDLPLAGAFTTATLRAEWTAPGIQPQMGTPAMQQVGLNSTAFDRWYETFSAGAPFAAVVSDLAPVVRARLEALQILSIAAVPVFAD